MRSCVFPYVPVCVCPSVGVYSHVCMCPCLEVCSHVCMCVPRCAHVFPCVFPYVPMCVCVCPSVGLCSHVCVCVPLHPHVCMCVPMCACVPVWECAPMRSCVFPCVHVSLCGTMFPHVCSPTSPCVHVCAQTRVHMPTGAQGDEEAVASTHAGARLSLHPCAEEPDISLSKALQRTPFLLSVGSVGYSHQKSRSQCHKENNNKGSFPRKGLEDNSVQHPV